MFEETNLIRNTLDSPRRRACFNQCRLQKFYAGGTIFDGNCPCDSPIECRFSLPDWRDEDEAGLLFPPIRDLYKQLADE